MTTPNRTPVKRALLSVSDKTGLVDMAKRLHGFGVELISTGGTRKAIADAGIPVLDIADVTGFPEMMDGRVKTLHPNVHGGLLAVRDHADHATAMTEHGIGGIDLVYINLYPFEDTVAAGADMATCIENIDIGGPAMIRSAAKNHAYVCVCTDAVDVEAVLNQMEENSGQTDFALRQSLAAKAYGRTAAYDSAISNWFADKLENTAPLNRSFSGQLKQTMRYGENPHQWASFYTTGNTRHGIATATQIQGKELSYNNINDTDAAFELVSEFDAKDGPAVAIIKHANPCGVATGEILVSTYEKALQCDPVSAFGGIVATNQPLDAETAQAITKVFTEVVIAPGADKDALAIFAAKKNLRLLLTDGMPNPGDAGVTFKSVSGGMLVQERDTANLTARQLKVVSKRKPTEGEINDMLFAFTVAKHVKSNAIVYTKDGQTAGIGAGQMNRRDSARIAALRAAEAAEQAGLADSLAKGGVCASDAFFPFADGLIQAAEAGVTAIIQPGGSIRDDEVIKAADELGLAMVFTGTRVFRH